MPPPSAAVMLSHATGEESGPKCAGSRAAASGMARDSAPGCRPSIRAAMNGPRQCTHSHGSVKVTVYSAVGNAAFAALPRPPENGDDPDLRPHANRVVADEYAAVSAKIDALYGHHPSCRPTTRPPAWPGCAAKR